MEDKFYWANETTLHPIGIAALVVLGLLTITLPRRYATVPLLIMACMIPSRQRIVTMELDWTFLRLLVLAGWVRVFLRSEPRRIRWIPLDTCVIALSAVTLLASTLRTGSTDILVRTLGTSFDSIGMYFLFRLWIRSWRDVDVVVRSLILIGIPVTLFMTYEHLTSRNLFSVFGGVPEFTLERQGKLRAQGAFSHPILAGCFWASLLPLFAAQAFFKRGVPWAVAGVSMALMCIYFSASSTPVMGAAMAVVGGAMFFVREWMRPIRWALLAVLTALHVVMNAPVWHLISRIDVVGGSTGWQRYALIDRSIKHLGEWALLGTSSTGHWGHAMQDVTNEYLVRGFSGGLLALFLFVAIIAFGFQAAGRLWRKQRGRRPRLILAWALGVSLFVHTVMFVAVSYFGQIEMIFALHLAILGSLASRSRAPVRATAPRPKEAVASTAVEQPSLGAGLTRRPPARAG